MSPASGGGGGAGALQLLPGTGGVLRTALGAGLSPVGLALQEQREPRLRFER